MTCKDCIHSGLCYKENDFNNFPVVCGSFISDKVLKELRLQGEWYHSCEKGWECSQCHEVVKNMPTVMRKANYNFCPNCGADMRKGVKKNE